MGQLAPPEKLANGFLKVEGRISRTGIQIYRDAFGKEHREYRPAEEVFKQASLDSFKLMPVTNTHPDKLLDATNCKDHQVGTVGENLRADGDYVAASMMLTDSEAIRAALCGRQELSCGYSCELVPEAGEYLGEKYDAIQRNILGNHVAMVDEARAGSGAAMRLDANDAIMVVSKPTREKSMPLAIKVDGLSIEVTDANASMIQQTVDRAIDSAKKDSADLLKKAEAKLDEVKAAKKSVVAKLALVTLTAAARKDAMKSVKAESMTCPECGGTGEVAKESDEEDGADKCDYCDGEGKVTALKDFGGKKSAAGADEDPDGDGDEDDDEMDAETELEVEQATEEQSKEAHKDAKEWAAKRAKARADGAKRHYAAVEARVRADQAARCSLETEARKHLGADEKFDGKSNSEIHSAVIKKLKPAAKIDGKDPKVISAMFELLTLDAAEDDLSPSDNVRKNIAMPKTPPVHTGNRKDAHDARAKMLQRNKDACKPAGQK